MPRLIFGMFAIAGGLLAIAPSPTTANTNLAIANPDIAAQITLPDGRVCSYVGPEPRAQDLGDPLTYDCGDGRGLRGAIEIDGTYMTVDREGRENLDRDAIIESQDIRFLIEEIVLSDGTICSHAGEGATLAFDGKRLNYTCDAAEIALIGDIVIQAGGVYQVEKAKLEGTELTASEMVTIRRLGASK